MAGCIDYYSHICYWGMADGGRNPCHDLWENNEEIHEDGCYFTDLISQKAVEYIRSRTGEDKPFYLYLGYNAPHYPMHAPAKYLNRFARLPWDRQVMAAMISAVDDGIGAITDELQRRGLRDNTVIYFQSDNGPSRESRNFMDGREDLYYGGSAGKFKGHKFSLFEGGIRVPGIFSWPAVIAPGRVISEPVVSMDIFPTLLKIAGGDTDDYQLNGKDILPVISGNAPSPHDKIFWEMDKQTAVRWKNYKLVLNGVLAEQDICHDEVFLSDLALDPGERVNVAKELPDITRELKEAALQWRQNLEEKWKTGEPA
jgi:arylsulfatase A-like enzyme